MEIKIYDRDLNRKGIIENHSSIIWTRKYFEPGNFEIHCPLTEANQLLLAKGNIVSKHGAIESGIVENIEYSDGADEKSIVASGRFMSSLFDRRLIQQTFSFNGKTEVAMRDLIQYVTAIPRVQLGTLHGFTDTVTFQATMKDLLSVLTKLSRSSGIGYRLVPNFTGKTLTFEVYKGVNRSASQSINNRVIFSDAYNNLSNMTYSWNDQIYKSKAIVGGEGEGSARVYVTVGGGTGLDLREVFVDAKDIRSADFDTNNEYLDALKQRGTEKLKSMQEVESFEYETLPQSSFTYKMDYDLGDIVTIKKTEWGVNHDARITEIQEIYENGGMTILPTLGNPFPETVEWSE